MTCTNAVMDRMSVSMYSTERGEICDQLKLLTPEKQRLVIASAMAERAPGNREPLRLRRTFEKPLRVRLEPLRNRCG